MIPSMASKQLFFHSKQGRSVCFQVNHFKIVFLSDKRPNTWRENVWLNKFSVDLESALKRVPIIVPLCWQAWNTIATRLSLSQMPPIYNHQNIEDAREVCRRAAWVNKKQFRSRHFVVICKGTLKSNTPVIQTFSMENKYHFYRGNKI